MGKKDKHKKKKNKGSKFFETIRDVGGLGLNDGIIDFIDGLDNGKDIDVPTVAKEIRERIKQGASVDDISYYQVKTLKATLSFFRIDGRSKLTYKEDMAKALVEAFGEGKDEHGKKSKEKNKKKKQDDEDDLSRLVIKTIKKHGGI